MSVFVREVHTLLGVIKKIFLWTYERNTWQWDTLCGLILVFIFLTPKSWFASSERHLVSRHPSPVAEMVLVGAEVVDNERDTMKLRDHVRALTGQSKAEVLAVRKVVDKEGKTLGYQVDIR